MKQAILMVVVACTAAMLVSVDADARRLGGGRTVGAPRDVATQRQMTPPTQSAAPAPVTPAAAPAAAKGAAAAAPAAAQPGWRRFMGPIAGIAAGLGIAALMSHMGLSEGFGHFLLILLAIVAVFVIVRLIMRRSGPSSSQGLQYAGAQSGAGTGMGTGSVGMGSSAQPTQVAQGQLTPAFDPYGPGSARSTGALAGSVAAANVDAAPRPYPAGFEPEPFLQQAKINFTRLQGAYDQGDTEFLRDVMTPEMFSEMSRDLAARGQHRPTEIVQLNAEILEVVSDVEHHWATVRFHGLTREDGVETPQSFDEAWNLRKAADGSSGWMLAGIQQLQ